MARIPDHTIDEVRMATDIVEVISAMVRLKKRGKNYLGLCPFHKEKTPSFTVSAEKQMYHCFGCGKGGNVYTFVMETEKVSFVEAVRTLAGRAGIEIPEERSEPTERETEAERLYSLVRFAGKLFHDHLTETEEGKEALEYYHRRGFTDETIRAFGLGYSLNTWDLFVKRAQQEGFKADELLKVGLARTRDDGSLYDYFRGRAMFPILSASGRLLAFGARKMREDDPVQGKYINSPETPIYNKSRVLFGLSHSKEAIRQEENAFMVEGYADLISLYQAGIRNVVASSGTALTEEQCQLIGRYSKNLTLVYDADSAGSNATIRGIDIALEHDLDVRIIALPQGEDPDSFVQRHGGKEFLALAERATSFIDFKAAKLKEAGLMTTPEGKTKAVRALVESIAKVRDELKRNFFIKDVAEKYGIYESILFREVDKVKGRERAVATAPPPPTPEPASGQVSAGGNVASTQPIPPEERDLLKLALEGKPEVLQYIFSNISTADLSDPAVRHLVQLALEMVEERGTVNAAAIVAALTDETLKNLITDILMTRYELSTGWKEMEKEIDEADPMKVAADAVRIIRKKSIRKAMDDNQRELRAAALGGQDTMPYVQRQQELMRLQRDLEQGRTEGTR